MIRRLFEDTSQHLMEEVSGTWEHSKGSLTLPLNRPVSSNTVPVGSRHGEPWAQPPERHFPHPARPGTWNTMAPVGML